MTFFEKLQAHEGGLVRLNPVMSRFTLKSSELLSGKIGMICDAANSRLLDGWIGEEGPVWMILLINGSTREALLYEDEVEFLEGSQ